MPNKIKFTITTAWIILTRSYDAYCTNQFTPNLEKESNPLVTLLGMTWTPLLITIGLLTIYTIYVLYIGIFKPKNLLPTESGYTFSQITAFTYLGHKDHWTAIFYKIPKDINRFNHWMGQTLPKCLSFAGLVSTMMWLLIHHSDYYKSIHSVSMIYCILISGCIVIIYNWNKNIFKQYLSSTSKY